MSEIFQTNKVKQQAQPESLALSGAEPDEASFLIDQGNPSRAIAEERTYSMIDILLEHLDFSIPKNAYPQIEIANNKLTTSAYAPKSNLILICAEHLELGYVYAEEILHWLRHTIRPQEKNGFKERIVDEFFGRLGESIFPIITKDQTLLKLFKEGRHFLRDYSTAQDSLYFSFMQHDRMLRDRNPEGALVAQKQIVFKLSHFVGYQLAEFYVAQNEGLLDRTKALLEKSVDEILEEFHVGSFLSVLLYPLNAELAQSAFIAWGPDPDSTIIERLPPYLRP